MKILLFGAGGQLGRELQGTAPVGVQVDAAHYPDVDFNDAKSIKSRIMASNPDWIINAAAYTAVDKAESEEDLANQLNHLAVAQIADIVRKTGKKLVHISTDFIFDGHACHPYLPASPANPQSVYGRTKLDGENAIRQTLQKDFMIIRTAWLYSSHGNNFVKTMLRLMKDRESLQVVDDQIGTPTWANGLARSVWRGMDKDLCGILHWTDAGVASWYDFAVAIQEIALETGLLDRCIPISPTPSKNYPTPAKRPGFSVLDKTETWQKLGTIPVHWRARLKRMMAQLAP